jgi:HEAT repeat protein
MSRGRRKRQQQAATGGGQRSQAATVAALAIAVGKTQVAAAAEAGIGERTLRGWLTKPAFRRKVDEIRAAMISEAVGRMGRGMAAAADVLGKMLGSRDPHLRFKAAKAVLELGTKLRESEELARRLADLERREAEREQGGTGL